MDLDTLVFVTLIFSMGFVSGCALGSVGLYLLLFAKGVREYTKRKKAYDEFVANLEQELEKSKVGMAAAEDFDVTYRVPHA